MKRTVMKALFAIGTVVAPAATGANANDADMVKRGEYLVTIMDCGGCHTPRGPNGAPIVEAGLSGGNVGFEIPGMGIFWPSNLTPDDTGLGDWSAEDIIATLKTGTRPDGRVLAPVMPWPSFAQLAEEDVTAIAAYLKVLAPAASTASEPIGNASDAMLPFYRVTMPGGQ